MQSLYALLQSKTEDLDSQQKFLFSSIESMENLYLLQLSLLIEIQKLAKEQITLSQKKYLATETDKNPNTKFVNNKVLQLLVNNETLLDTLEAKKITNWDLDDKYVRVIYDAILKSEIYQKYMASSKADFISDKEFLADLFKEVVAPNDKLYEYIEDQSLTWLDDLPVVNTIILKKIRKILPAVGNSYFLQQLYKDEDDKKFTKELFTKTLLNDTDLSKEIEGKTPNWDKERIAEIDAILLKMAITEFLKFPSIPVKVTMNEYLEIAKEYSTPKSSIFINGVLDKLVKEYKETKKLNKIGRGLL
jgi:N utilization substance protein B